jgi:hypothetical protein
MSIRLVEQQAPEPCIEIAEWAEDLAARARSGEVQSIVFVISLVDGKWFTGIRGESLNGREVVGELEAMKADLLGAMKS